MPKTYKTTEQLFLEKVSIPKDHRVCWEWQAYKMSDGYGVINIKGNTVLAHRYSYLMFNGKLTEGLVVRHTCDNPGCVNPNHLRLGTIADNVKDCVDRGRWSNGALGKKVKK